jgi:integrin alpha FG-GAP repeat containing protein 1
MKSPGLVLFDTSFNPPVPQGIKLGDMNQDGYPDLLFILSSDPGGIFASADSLPQILLSSGCKTGSTGCVKNGYGTGYQVLKKDADAFTGIKDAASVSFVDLDEDVSPDTSFGTSLN